MTQKTPACLIVRAQVPTDERAAFDRWYQTEHLPDALAAFKAVGARRGWVDDRPATHVAIYEFASMEQARAVAGSPEIEALIAEFDRVWEGRVTRTREFIGIEQVLKA